MIDERYYVKVKDLMELYGLPRPTPKNQIPLIVVTVELWSDLNVYKSD